MSRFYTSIYKYGNQFLVREIRDGIRLKYKETWKPYLFAADPNGQQRTLDGKAVSKFTFASMGEYYATYGRTPNPAFSGYDNWNVVYTYDSFPGQVEYDINQIRTAWIDIEVDTTGGKPNLETADKEITAITVVVGKEIHAFGCKDFDLDLKYITLPDGATLCYHRCMDERELLLKFVDVWSLMEPDVVSGWNISQFDIPYLIKRLGVVLRDDGSLLSPWGAVTNVKSVIRGRDVEVPSPVGISVLDYYVLYTNKKLHPKLKESYALNYIAHIELGEKKLDYSEFSGLDELHEKNFQKFMEYNIKDALLVQALDDKLKFLEVVYTLAYGAKINYVDVLGSVRQWEAIIHGYLRDQGIVMPLRIRQDEQLDDEHKGGPRKLMGGYVKDPKVGGYSWIVSLDLDSLYSHLIMQYNVSPETYVGRDPNHPPLTTKQDANDAVSRVLDGEVNAYRDDLKAYDMAVAGNFCFYSRKKRGFLPVLLEQMYNNRVGIKAKMLEAKDAKEQAKTPEEKKVLEAVIARFHNAQGALKINLNSAYGVFTNEWFLFYSHDSAEAITISGQVSIRWIEREVNAWMNKVLRTKGVDYIVASDTDSIYINFEPFVKQCSRAFGLDENDVQAVTDFLDNVCKTKLADVVKEAYDRLATYMNAMDQKMSMKRESICDKAIWTGAKHYILNIIDKEGVRLKEPEIEMKGIQAVQSSTPSSCREKIKAALKIIMRGNEGQLKEFVGAFHKEFMTLPYDEIARTSGISGINKYTFKSRSTSFGGLVSMKGTKRYVGGTPQQVKGAINYNWIREKRGLTHLPEIFNGDKAKYVYLTRPNPINDNVIALPSGIPTTVLGLDEYVDKEMQFEKGFKEPLDDILKAVGWTVEAASVSALDEFF